MANPYQHPPLPPYLGSWAIASLAFTSPIVLALLLTIMRLILAINSANENVANAKLKLASSCLGLEQAASVAVSFPHYLAGNVNNGTARSVEAVAHGLGTVLDLSVVGIEAIVIFIVDTYRSMYLCLADLVVRGSLAVAIGATEEFNEFLTNAMGTIRTGLQEAVSGVDNLLDDAVKGLNHLPGVNIDPPNITPPSLSFLENVTLPDGFLNSLQSLNSSLPTLDELKEQMNSIIAVPFEGLRTSINGTLGNATVDRNLLPIPQKEQLAFCADLDLSFVDDVGESLVKIAKIGIFVIIAVILLFVGFAVYKERWAFGSLLTFVNRSRSTWTADMGYSARHNEKQTSLQTGGTVGQDDVDRVLSTPTLLGFITASGNPLLRTFLPWLMDKIPPLRKSKRARSNFTWFFAYITYLPALLVLLVALLGLLTIEIQLAALKPAEGEAQKQVDQGLSGFRGTVMDHINNSTRNTSSTFAGNSNKIILDLQNSINDDMFGWVNETSVTLNTTIVSFYDGLTSAISGTFGNTVLKDPALDVVNCLIGSKIIGLSHALTWLHDNAHVTLPLVDEEIFMLSPEQSEELVSSLDDPQGQSSSSHSIVRTLVDGYRKALEKERIVFLVMLGLYGLVILFGLLAILWHEVIGPRIRRRRASFPIKEFILEKEQNLPAVITPFAAKGSRVKGLRCLPRNLKLPSISFPLLSRRGRVASDRPETGDTMSAGGLTRAQSPPPGYLFNKQAGNSSLSLLPARAAPDQGNSAEDSGKRGLNNWKFPYAPGGVKHHQALQDEVTQLPYVYQTSSSSLASHETLHSSSVPQSRPPASVHATRNKRASANPFATPFDGHGEE